MILNIGEPGFRKPTKKILSWKFSIYTAVFFKFQLA